VPENISIVGGGLAGLALGIGLRQRGVPVTLWEAGCYPRHRVCGEFISGSGQNSLARLGLLDGLHAAGVCSARSAAFFDGAKMVVQHPLPEAALCISRHELDQSLAHQFQRLGGELRQGERWCGKFGEGIVRASGRRAEPVTDGWRLFGLKVHARGVPLDADLEMHFVPSGYVGLCKLASGEVNICGLFRSKETVPDLAQRWRDWLGGPSASVLHSRLAFAQFDENSFCSVAGLCLRPQCAIQRNECCIGDALTMIPPVTGNGMSMAFESAELAVEPLAKFSHGELTWAGATPEIASRCEERFGARLRWAAWLQRALFQPRARLVLMFLAARSEWLWRAIFERTR
jgi:2-polyprenyl-6-methoxyphenol hydroxylase-like FAD-dependent oxidoreductase